MGKVSLLSLLFSYQGRINRGKYWIAVAIYFGITILLVAIGFIIAGNSILAAGDDDSEDVLVGLFARGIGFLLIVAVVYVPMVISGVMVGIKRLHDRDKSGWWLLLFYVLPAILNMMADSSPAGGLILSLASVAITIWAVVELGFLRGTAGPNKYGPDPLAA